MNKNDQQFMAQRIRAQYVDKQAEVSELDKLRALDAKVQTPAHVFSYIFGAFSALVMGAGMSLVMTDIGTVIGLADSLLPGIVIGVVGMILAVINYPIHKGILKARKKKYASKILALSEEIMKNN